MYVYFYIIFILICYLFTFIFKDNNDTSSDLLENDYYTSYTNEHSSIL
jgi:hypothetical protein